MSGARPARSRRALERGARARSTCSCARSGDSRSTRAAPIAPTCAQLRGASARAARPSGSTADDVRGCLAALHARRHARDARPQARRAARFFRLPACARARPRAIRPQGLPAPRVPQRLPRPLAVDDCMRAGRGGRGARARRRRCTARPARPRAGRAALRRGAARRRALRRSTCATSTCTAATCACSARAARSAWCRCRQRRARRSRPSSTRGARPG